MTFYAAAVQYLQANINMPYQSGDAACSTSHSCHREGAPQAGLATSWASCGRELRSRCHERKLKDSEADCGLQRAEHPLPDSACSCAHA